MRFLVQPLAAIELLNKNSKILVIGPRSEWDLFLLGEQGFTNVYGVDLISYSKTILVGDMHNLSKIFKRDFDAVLCGWTISYSSKPQQVANEILSILKPGGIIGVAVEYALDDPSLDCKWKSRDGYVLNDREKLPQRVNSVKQIHDLFGESIDTVYFSHDAPLKLAHHPDKALLPKVSAVSTIFSVMGR